MKKINKLLSILLATLLIMTLFPTNLANAADDVITFSAQADTVGAKAGDVVNVNINMTETSKIAALTLSITYDNTALKILSANSHAKYSMEEFNTVFADNKLVYLGASAMNETVSGTLFTIQFEVLKDGCTEVSLSVNEIADIDLNPLESATKSTKIHYFDNGTVTSPTCTKQGYTTYTCECGNSYADNYVDANGHNFVDGACTECGEKSVKWSFDEETGTLTIYGTGPMDDYNSYNRPWVELINDIKKVVVTNGVTKIGNDAFSGCKSLTNLIISDSVKIIGNNAFSGCTSLTNLTIPDSVTTIGGCAFNSCESIESVAIGSGVTTIGDGAFTWCDSLTYITVSDSNQCFSNDEYGVLFNKDKTILIQYPIGNERNTYTIPDGVTTIYNDAFDESINLTSVIIPNSVTTIGYYAFAFCINLTSVTIPDSVTTIGKYAFSNCINLMDVTISNSLNTISEKSFYRCYKLTSIAIGDSVTAIDNWAFGYCTSLTNVTIPDSVMSIGDSAFYDCENLTNVTILNSLISIDNYTFYNCQSLIDVYYSGSKEEWNNILIGDNNYYLVNATIHYNYCEHKYIFVITLPTCTEQGFTTYTCTVCDDTYVDDETSATGHSYTSQITTPATHLATGVMTFTCTCGDTYTEIIEKTTEHNHEAVVTSPTCTEQGYTTYTCECGDTYVADYVNATGHSYNSVVTEPTCTESGYTTHTCSACGDDYVDSQTSATGHNYAEEITKPATHTENGVMTYICHCGDSYTETINATGDHYYVPTVTPPTCTEGGYTTYTCACNDSYVGDETPATGHDYDYENGVLTRPTDSTKGYYVYLCKNDTNHRIFEDVESADYTEYDKAVEKLGEYLSNSNLTPEAKEFIVSECVKIIQNNDEFYESGIKERRNLIASEQHIIDKVTNELNEHYQVVDSFIANCEAGNHDVREYVSDDNATCTENGTKRGNCYVCGTEVVVTDENNPAFGHDIIVDDAVLPDCVNTGLTEGSHCSRCDDATVEQEIVSALGHSYNSVVTEPTCTESGYTTHTCSVCGDNYADSQTNATGHNYAEEITIPATHTENGLMTYTCHCGDSYTETINATGAHFYVPTVTPPTCTEDGYTTYTCACGDSYVDNETPANGHSFTNGICTVCGDEDPDYYVFSIKTPSQTIIRNKDGIILHTEIEGNTPEGSYVEWTSSNGNFDETVMNEGNSLRVIANKKGYTTFTATLYDADGNALATESVELYSKSGFFDKIGGFFRSIFGSTKVHES